MEQNIPDIPEEQDIETVIEKVKKHPSVKFIGEHSSEGFEYRVGGEGQEWLINSVENNEVRFDNPNRIESGHPYGLILPEE